MKKLIFAAGAAALAIGTAGIASAASTPCAASYVHPAQAKSLKASLVQAFVSCNNPGGATPNATVNNGGVIPTCFPAESFHQHAGQPALGWVWGPKSSGSLTFKAGKNKVAGPLNTAPDSVDLNITVKISDVHDNTGLADGTSGNGQALSRATLIDRAHDQVETVIDFPTGFSIPVVNGKINKKTSATVILNHISQPALRACSTIELVSFLIKDPNGNTFANLGTYLP